MNLSKSMRLAIAENGIKHKDLAKHLGVSNRQISHWLKSGSIKPVHLIAVADYFGMKVSEFVALGE